MTWGTLLLAFLASGFGYVLGYAAGARKVAAHWRAWATAHGLQGWPPVFPAPPMPPPTEVTVTQQPEVRELSPTDLWERLLAALARIEALEAQVARLTAASPPPGDTVAGEPPPPGDSVVILRGPGA
jgi:hypothetical protein